jgi:hypothetical protein
MITRLQVKIAVARILQRKREKNEALKVEQKQPRFPLIAMFAEIQKELERPGTAVPPSHLDSVLLEMVRAGELIPMTKGFTLPNVVKADSRTIEKNWSK